MSHDDPDEQNYDRLVYYYVAPAVLIASLLFCCFRMALVYYVHIRPLRQSREIVVTEPTPRSTMELEEASTAFPSACREIFLRPPPPSYSDTIKNDRRSLSVNDADALRRERRRSRTRNVSQSTNQRNVRSTLQRAQSNVTGPIFTISPQQAPPEYDQTRRSSAGNIDIVHLSPDPRQSRLPSYEEVVIEQSNVGIQSDVLPV
ncbi:hypothetical protein M3Y98_00287100 [Aphelenchoides besseyi]|nr:hypothetical protein M3Y98_00287100 [Aphelenchoides besseyi]KAI6201095.1 hypothetical protein M3Y96_00805000 [Aphelenchoides besseyi]